MLTWYAVYSIIIEHALRTPLKIKCFKTKESAKEIFEN